MKTAKKFFLFSIILFLGISGWFVSVWWSFLNSPLIPKGDQPLQFVFVEGATVKKAAYSLQQQNILKNPLFFVLFVRLSGNEYKLQAGEYLIEPGMTPRELVHKMIKGDVIQYSFTIVEGWTFSKMIAALNDDPNVGHTIQGLTSEEVMAKIGHPGEVPEGRFAPDTYLFRSASPDVDILVAAYKLMQKRLQEAWDDRADNLAYRCPYEALIVASLVEKETGVDKERPVIAGVILYRLKKRMLLQIDPTVIYGLGEKFTGKLSKKDLLADTPYNTYIRRGLPPSPIAMPGEASIKAALHPDRGTALYYVSKGDGTHEFSDNLKDHNRAVKKYLLNK